MDAITVTTRHVRRLRDAGPSGWLVSDGVRVRVTAGRHDPTMVIEIATGNVLTDLAEVYREAGVTATDDILAADLCLIADRFADTWPLTCMLWPLANTFTTKLTDHGIARCGPPSLFITRDDMLGIRQPFAPTGHTHTGPAPHVRLEIVAEHGASVTIATNERRYQLAATAPPGAIAVFCAAAISASQPQADAGRPRRS
jgi:hypothetical protein